LVIPIPNFVTDYNSGLAGALQAAYQAQTSFASASVAGQGSASGLAAARQVSVDPKSEVLTQMAAMPGMNGPMGAPAFGGAVPGLSPNIYGAGPQAAFPGTPQGFGGSPLANFGELINLIQTVVTPDAWEANSGSSSMIEHRQTLSLLVRAPQETHEALADLLKSLRALQNLQVTIEVRFIQLQDTFFERIGIDFDIKKDDNVRRLPNDDSGPAVAVGLSAANSPTGPTFTSDLDIGLNNTFSVNPPFGAPDIGQATTFGLAILSDLELFFFLEASQGNSRQNVLNAPKVTMFDGQIASINDSAQRPFVISFEPVVGDFAVAQKPIVVVLNEGTQMNVQSVVSQDRRFVRMTLVPQFTRLENTDRQFTFTGRRSTNTGTSILNPNTGLPTGSRDEEDDVIEGTTVQQPTIGITQIQTTVNVPDGGTILLGGIKRLSEGRVERGTPILSKIPYLNRLFKNNAIGRETSTLMMTVSPRIIIPEEEEEKVVGSAPTP
jgi:general secretion pathway protein D